MLDQTKDIVIENKRAALNTDGLINYLIPLWRDSMSSSPASAVSSVGFAELGPYKHFMLLRIVNSGRSSVAFGSPDSFLIAPKVYESKCIPTYQIL
jgi:hypothetical protein